MLTLSVLVIVLLVVGLLTGWISQTQIAVAESYRDRLVARFPVLAKLQEKFGPKAAAPVAAPVAANAASTANSVSSTSRLDV